MRAVPLRLWAMSLFSAVLQVLPFPIAGPVPLWRRTFCWFCLTPLLWALLSKQRDGRPLTVKQSAALSYLCGVLWYLGNCYWIYPTMHIYGDIASPVAFGILILFAMYVGLYHALFGALLGWLRRSYSRQVVLGLSPFAWVAVELARARVTGFPWDLLGYTQVDNLTLTRLAPWTGVFGLSLVVALVNALWLARIPVRSKNSARWGLALAGVLCVAATVLAVRTGPAESSAGATAVLLQDNLKVGAEASGRRESQAELLDSLSSLSLQPLVKGATPDIVVWPEAPADFFDADPEFRQVLGAVAKQTKAPVVVDSISLAATERGKVLNTASFFAPDGSHSGQYYKMHLVPFGEYTPYKQLFFFAGHLLDQVGPFIPGTQRELLKNAGHSYGIFICYESIFGDEIREFARSGADVLVNISDDGWYGDSSAPWEHLDMVRMRAIENHRWVLRATNTGITGSIDPEGRLVAQMPRHVRSSMSAPFGYGNKQTFYTRHGDWLAWLCAGVTVGALGLGGAFVASGKYTREGLLGPLQAHLSG